MTELEWAEVTMTFVKMFETLKEIRPAAIDLDKVYKAGKILMAEKERLGGREHIHTYIKTEGMRHDALKIHNARIEKLKESQHDIDQVNFTTLEQKLKASIAKVEREKQK